MVLRPSRRSRSRPFPQPPDLGRGDHILVGPHRFLAPFTHQPSPSDDQARGEPMATSNIADRHARLQRLVDGQELLLRRKPPPPGNAGDDFHLRKRVGHRRMPRTKLGLAPPANAGDRSKRGAVQRSSVRCQSLVAAQAHPGQSPCASSRRSRPRT